MYKSRLKLVRENMNLTQQNVANVIQIHRARYSQYENETDIIPINHLIKFCDYFNVSLDYIFEFNNIKQYDNYIKDVDATIAGNRLKEFRKDNNLTQAKLAEVLNTNQSVVANYERGRNVIATPFLYDICKKYNISADYLLGRVDNPKYLNFIKK